MSTRHIRSTSGRKNVVVASKFAHLHGRNSGRQCSACGTNWTVEIDADENFYVWRNGQAEDDSILDWTGLNVAIECCSESLE